MKNVIRVFAAAALLSALSLTGISCASETGPAAPAPEPRKKIDAALFIDDGSGGAGVFHWARLIALSPQMKLSFVTGKDIRAGALKGRDLVIFPGGYSPRQYKALQEQGAAAVRDFVSSGGSYLGICAGFASALNCKERIRLLPFGRKPKSGGKLAKLLVEITERGGKVLDLKPGKYLVRYNGGPIACPGEKPGEGWGEGLALFKSTTSYHNKPEGNFFDTPAIIHGRFGKGKVIATSFHPESWESTHPIALGCIYAVTGVKPTPRITVMEPYPVKAGFCTSCCRPTPENVAGMMELERHPRISMKLLDGHEMDVGNLNLIDVLILPDGAEASYKKLMSSPLRKAQIETFLARGGRIIAVGNAGKFLPEKGHIKRLPDNRESVKYTLRKNW